MLERYQGDQGITHSKTGKKHLHFLQGCIKGKQIIKINKIIGGTQDILKTVHFNL